MPGGVFINYRGNDSYSYGALLHAELARHFGLELVFLDSVSIPAGADFVEQLLGRVRQARVVLAVIGTQWLEATGSDGGRLIDDPADWIRRELEEAFAAGVLVIPVLTDAAQMPTEADLPEDLRALARCQFRRLRHRDATSDLARLVADLAAVDPGLRVAARRERGVPRQLPKAPVAFTGRARELDRLTEALMSVADAVANGEVADSGVVVISAIAGTAGVGKTALAVHWAHRVAEEFPDGQLYVNLRGFDPGGVVMDPAEAVRGFLDALDVPVQRIPVGLDAQAALYRSLLAERRMLVVLDNARDPGQVRPLLPAAPGCLVLVTSRNDLAGLVAADGAQAINLDLLSVAESRELLANRLGRDRVAAEPEAVEQIITYCARLPLALTIAAARAATHPDFRLTALAAELADTRGRLEALDAGDPVAEVRAVFSWSYTTLTPPAARLFRLLGLHPGPNTSVAAAASLAGLPRAHTRRLLTELTRASLTTEHILGRYGLHDLLAAYASELSHTFDLDEERREAVGRLLDHYTHTAHTAARLLDPTADPILLPLAPPADGTVPEQPADGWEAMAWLTVEHPVLLAALRLAAAAGFDTQTWQLTWGLDTFLNRRGRWQDLAGAWQGAVDAAYRLATPAAAACAHRELAWAGIRLGRYGQAHTHLRRALDLYAEAGDRVGQAHTHHVLGYLWERQARPGPALGHAEQALTLFRAAGHRRGQALALNAVGWCHALLGEHTQAIICCQQALPLYQQLGDRAGEADTWDSLGYAHHHLGQHTQADDCYQHALTLFRDLGDRYQEATTLTNLGDTHHAAGNPDQARTAWTTALDILTNLDHPDADAIQAKLRDLDEPDACIHTE